VKGFFSIKVKTINQQVQEHPPSIVFFCDKIVPLGLGLVREYDANECIHVWKVWNIKQGMDIFGIEGIETMAQWRNVFNTNCQCCTEPAHTCGIKINQCIATINDCFFSINNKPVFR